MQSPFRFPVPTILLTLGLSLSNASAVTLLFDYSHDSFFASHAAAKWALEAAAADIESVLNGPLTAIDPGHQEIVGNFESSTATFSWSFNYTNPTTGATVNRADTSVAADDFVIYAGMRNLSGTTLGEGAAGGVSVSVSTLSFPEELAGAVAAAELESNLIYSRGNGPTVYTLGGSVGGVPYSVEVGASIGHLWFDSDRNNNGAADDLPTLESLWHFDHTTPVAAGKSDFYSVAVHEILHTLGIGSAQSWDDLVDGTTWNGAAVSSLYGSGENLVDSEGGHITSGLMSVRLSDGQPQEVAMSSSLVAGTRRELTMADVAFLQDIGWQTSVMIPEPSTAGLSALAAVTLLLRRRRGREEKGDAAA